MANIRYYANATGLAAGSKGGVMNDASLMAAYAELHSLMDAEHVPRVKTALLSLSQRQTKLFCTVLESIGAADGSRLAHNAKTLYGDGNGLRLEPSNFLSELLAAMRTLEWPKVVILIHGLASPAEAEHSAVDTGPPTELKV